MFRDQQWKPVEKKAKKLTYLQIDRTTGEIDQPNPERIELWKTLLGNTSEK
jgi:hypothetical protein